MFQFYIIDNPEKTGWSFSLGVNYYNTKSNYNLMFYVTVYKKDFCFTLRKARSRI